MALIMVIDDDETLLEMIKDVLSSSGHELALFRDGLTAIRYLQNPANKLPRVILADVMMPNVDGYSFSIMLQEDKRTRDVPVIVITAKKALRPVFEPARNVAAFLEKPFELTVLKKTVEDVMKGGLRR